MAQSTDKCNLTAMNWLTSFVLVSLLVIVIQTHGTSPAGESSGDEATSAFRKLLVSALLRSDVFKSIYSPISSPDKIYVFRAALGTVVKDLGVDSATSDQIITKGIQAVSALSPTSDSRDYAEALAEAISQGLEPSGQINDGNVKHMVSKVSTAFLRTAFPLARSVGIRFPGLSVDSDIRNINSYLLSSGGSTETDPSPVTVGDSGSGLSCFPLELQKMLKSYCKIIIKDEL